MSYHLFSKTLSTARKPHRCVWCSLPTLVGSKYIREKSVADGSFQNFAWHEACWADARDYFEQFASGEDTFTSGNDMPFHALYQLEAHAA